MRAAVVEKYGPPETVVIREVPTPVPGDGEVLIRVRATSVNSGDARVRALRVPAGLGLMMRLALGFSGPRQPILGFDVAGEIEAVGKDVRSFKTGDRVVASRGFKHGAHAECFVVAETGVIARIPEGISEADAVSVLFGGVTALEFFRRGELKSGETILVNGASGAVGVAAVQLARHIGATVTAVCSAANADLMRALGASRVIDYKAEDFAAGSETYDVIMDNHGTAAYPRVRHLLKPGGRFMKVIFPNLREMLRGGKDIVAAKDDTAITPERYRELMGLLADGVLKPVIDSTYRFEDIVAAYRRVDTGHKVGSVVLTVGT